MDTVLAIVKYGFVVIFSLEVGAILVALVRLAREKARPTALVAAPASDAAEE